jgi:murein DD-endopeptidase MepM/ murein hydrolase activator NlpD
MLRTGFLSILLLAGTALGVVACSPAQNDQTAGVESSTNELVAANGFTYPLSSMGSWPDNNFAACGAYYVTNYCHSGSDILTSYGTTVYAMAAGTVLAKSGTQDPGNNCSSGWGYDYGQSNTCNMALAVQHYDDDGNPFVVVYGHLRYTAGNGAGTTFIPGAFIGVIGRYYNTNGTPISSDHLHWGVRPGTSAPTYWGRVYCSGASQPAGQSFPTGCSPDSFVAPGTYMNFFGRNWVAPPVAPTLVSPANGATVTTSSVPLQWSNGSGTFRSHIMVCTNAALTINCINPDGGMVGVETTGTGANRSTSYSAAVGYATWYWAVRGIAYNDYGGWGSYSTVRSFVHSF